MIHTDVVNIFISRQIYKYHKYIYGIHIVNPLQVS